MSYIYTCSTQSIIFIHVAHNQSLCVLHNQILCYLYNCNKQSSTCLVLRLKLVHTIKYSVVFISAAIFILVTHNQILDYMYIYSCNAQSKYCITCIFILVAHNQILYYMYIYSCNAQSNIVLHVYLYL